MATFKVRNNEQLKKDIEIQIEDIRDNNYSRGIRDEKISMLLKRIKDYEIEDILKQLREYLNSDFSFDDGDQRKRTCFWNSIELNDDLYNLKRRLWNISR